MLLIIEAAFIASLIAIIVQDFKLRAIYWWLFPIVFVSSCFISQNYFEVDLINRIAINSLIIGLQLGFLWLFIKLRNIDIKTAIGLGDVIFFFSITPLFHPLVFVTYYVFGLAVSLIWYLVYSLISKEKTTIPLAGILSFVVLLLYVIDRFTCNLLLSEEIANSLFDGSFSKY